MFFEEITSGLVSRNMRMYDESPFNQFLLTQLSLSSYNLKENMRAMLQYTPKQ
jgi:hypothetical protein